MSLSTTRISVCHLISGDLWAGAEVMAYHLICSLARKEMTTVSAIVFNNGRLSNELKNAGIDVTVIEESKNSFPVLVYKAYQLIRSRKIDIIHSHRQKENILALLAALLLGKVKLISTIHGMPEFTHNKLSINAIVSKINFHILSLFFNRTVSVSNEVRETLINNNKFSQQKIDTIHNGIPLVTDSYTKKYNARNNFTIGSAGRLVPVKDFDLFIAIAEQLRDNENIHFLLAGDGPLSIELKQKSSELKLDNITFLGHTYNMNEFYKQIDLFINTSIHEGIPMTILESMSRGIPIIAPNVGGIPEIITNNKEGFLIKTRDPQQYAEKCRLLSMNHEAYEKMAESAKTKIYESFSITKMQEKYLQTYYEIL